MELGSLLKATNDVIPSGLLQYFQTSSDLTVPVVLLTLVLAFVIGVFIYFVYKQTFSGVMFSKNFGSALVMLCLVTAMMILPITSNIVLSLGMVGALSIVRFRTAVKDPMDTVFMFWSIAAGVTLGAKQYTPAVIGSLIIGGLMVLSSVFKHKRTMPYLLIIRFEESARADVQNALRRMPQGNIKSKTVNRDYIELTIEMRLTGADMQNIEKLGTMHGVLDASVIAYNGEIA